MTFDLTMLPGDWWLGVWWTEHQGSHWMLLVRRMFEGNETLPSVWCFDERVRLTPDDPWRVNRTAEAHSRAGACQKAYNRFGDVSLVLLGGRGWEIFCGQAPEVRDVLRRRPWSLPRWLTIELIEVAAVSPPTVPNAKNEVLP